MTAPDHSPHVPDPPFEMRAYSFHGVPLTLSAPDMVLAALHARLRNFSVEQVADGGLRFEFSRVSPGSTDLELPSATTRVVYESPLGQVLYDDRQDRLFIIHANMVRVVCQPVDGYTRVAVVEGERDKLWLVSHPFFTIPLIECLKRRGHYNLHAAGACIGGNSVLLPGASGSGKSTLAIALARAGFGFLSDDMVFLARQGGNLRVLAFPDEIDVTEQTTNMFPELSFLLARPKPPGWHKRQFLIDEVYQGVTVTSCRPVSLVFPSIARNEQSALKEIKPDEALREILPNVLLTRAADAQAHLDALGELVRTCSCFRLETGRDFAELALLLRGVLA